MKYDRGGVGAYTWQPTTSRLQKLRAGYVLIAIPRRSTDSNRAIEVANTLFSQTFSARNFIYNSNRGIASEKGY